MVVQSIKVRPYEDALSGFKSVWHGETEQIIFSDLKGSDISARIRALGPTLILALGIKALSEVKEITDIPVVYCMVLNPGDIPSGNKNIFGVSMNISPKKQFSLLLKILPGMNTVGLLYNPESTGYFVKEIREGAAGAGIKLIAKETTDTKEVPGIIKTLKGKADLFWMLPDTTVVTPETIKYLLMFSIGNRIPILTFSERYLPLGMLITITTDAYDMGIQAGEMAHKILSGKGPETRHIRARKPVIRINRKIAEKLGIKIDEKIIREIAP